MKVQQDRHSTLAIAVGTAGGFVLAFFCPLLFPQCNFFVLIVPGIACVIVGTCWRWYAILTLGSFFTGKVMIARDHRLIQHGPYRYLRHPSYTGILLVIFGFGLMTTNILSAIALTLGMLGGLLYRMQVEEKALQQTFGETYHEYKSRTWKLLPFLF
ncbi:methyltransferase family protein [Ktedonospora formicarum]|uniref:methyltransferase family protein n=1 Tax=Ktedonospora formicarum TaxID=2778364 RepID=UPI001C68E5D3|nr:isoprenylcysteine carboxylmethyltransferase family protein [Ktedonospora formicarum]